MDMGSAICGGIVSQSKFKKDPMAYMMAFIMPDEQYDKYMELKKQNKTKEASMLFKKYAVSVI